MDDAIKRPVAVTLTEDEVKAFAVITQRQTELAAKQAAVQEFLKTVVHSGEARMTELQMAAQQLHSDTRKLWVGLKGKYGLDLDTINFELSEDGKSVVPTAMKL